MRLDLLLKQSGLIKRRVIAKQFCEKGLVLLNGKVGKPSSEVKDGDSITVTLGKKVVTCDIRFEVTGKKTTIHVIANDVHDDGDLDA